MDICRIIAVVAVIGVIIAFIREFLVGRDESFDKWHDDCEKSRESDK